MDLFNIDLTKESSVPKYIHISDHIEKLIKDGSINTGDKLPPIRKIAEKLKVNNVTVVNAYKNLETKELITAIKGSGYYVKYRRESDYTQLDSKFPIDDIDPEYQDKFKLMANGQIEVSSSAINFASATPDPEIFPFETFKSALNEVLDRDKGYAFGYQESNGYAPLRDSLCSYFLREYGIVTEPDTIQIVSGAQQGIDIIGKSLLKSGDYVITENPTYTGASAVFKSRGANVIGIPIESDGIDIELLENKIIAYKPKLIYIMTRFQNPTTATYSSKKLRAVLSLAEKYNVYIVEDDSMSGISYSSDISNITLKSLDKNNRVIYIKSFSKLLMPGLRIGFVVTPKSLIKGVLAAKHSTDISSSGLIQRALQVYFKKGHWEDHLACMQRIYSDKYQVMLRELKSLKPLGVSFNDPKGGLNFWLRLPNGISATKLYEECLINDVLIVPCSIFYVNDKNAPDNAIRLSFAATNEEEIIRGIKIIGKCISNIKASADKRTFISPLI